MSIKGTTGDFGRQVSEWIVERFRTHFEALVEEGRRELLIDLLKLYFKGSKKLEKDIEKLCREAIIEKIIE